MKTGWQKIGGSYYYFSKTTGALQTGWVKDNGNYYYLDKSTGVLKTGWIKDNGKYYYFSPSTGAMQTRWVYADGKYYYFSPSDGTLQPGYVKDGNDWYYLDPITGALQTGWVNETRIEGEGRLQKYYCYFNASTGRLEKIYKWIDEKEVPISLNLISGKWGLFNPYLCLPFCPFMGKAVLWDTASFNDLQRHYIYLGTRR